MSWLAVRFAVRARIEGELNVKGDMGLLAGLTCMVMSLCACGGSEPTGDGAGALESLAGDAPVVRNSRDGAWDSGSAWRLQETLRIGVADGTGPEVFASVTDLAVDGMGRIYVLDRQSREVRVFGSSGEHVRSLGREGSGPGEFRDPIGLAWDPDGHLWVVDPGNARFTIFDTAGTYLDTRRRLSNFYSIPWPGGFGEDGRLYDHVQLWETGEPGRDGLVVLDRTAEPIDTIWLPVGEEESFELTKGTSRIKSNVPFTSSLIWRFDPSGFVWLAETGEYRIYQRKLAGEVVRVVEKEYEPEPVTASEKAEALEGLDWFRRQGGEVDPSRIPDEKPAISSFSVDPEGYLWVDPVAGADSLLEVFDPSGAYLGPTGPSPLGSYPPPVFTSDAVYGVTRDSLGVAYVVRLEVIGR